MLEQIQKLMEERFNLVDRRVNVIVKEKEMYDAELPLLKQLVEVYKAREYDLIEDERKAVEKFETNTGMIKQNKPLPSHNFGDGDTKRETKEEREFVKITRRKLLSGWVKENNGKLFTSQLVQYAIANKICTYANAYSTLKYLTENGHISKTKQGRLVILKELT